MDVLSTRLGQKKTMDRKKKLSPAGNRTPVSRVTGGDTHHYTTEDVMVNWKYFKNTSRVFY